ncbi:MAG: AEC family transporter [Oscillospiraceae bacterium]|jgi:predicted permease|nr:AEC family transporter [Oscillospiraceae bacterium]
MVANAFSGVLTLLLCIGAGVLAVRLGYLDEDAETRLSRLTLHFSVPCLLFMSCLDHINLPLLEELGFALLLPGLIILLSWVLAAGLGKLFRVKKENFGLYCVMFSMSNTIFIGLPVCLAIFGERALPLVSAYFPFNTLAFWTLGAAGIAADGGHAGRPKARGRALANIFSPPLAGALTGAACAIFAVRLPAFVSDALRYMGNMTVPAALLLAGCTVTRMGRDVLRPGREGALTVAGRFVAAPLISYALCVAVAAPPLVTQVFTVESAMPVMSQSMLVARAYSANHKLAAQMITLTTLLCLPYVPLLMFLLEKATG